MKCPKCGYHSFEHLDECKKCGQGLREHKAKFNLRGFIAVGQAAPAAAHDGGTEVGSDEPAASPDSSDDFGFDFLEEETGSGADIPAAAVPETDFRDISIDQPFGIDTEALPADDLPPEEQESSDDKSEKGPEVGF